MALLPLAVIGAIHANFLTGFSLPPTVDSSVRVHRLVDCKPRFIESLVSGYQG